MTNDDSKIPSNLCILDFNRLNVTNPKKGLFTKLCTLVRRKHSNNLEGRSDEGGGPSERSDEGSDDEGGAVVNEHSEGRRSELSDERSQDSNDVGRCTNYNDVGRCTNLNDVGRCTNLNDVGRCTNYNDVGRCTNYNDDSSSNNNNNPQYISSNPLDSNTLQETIQRRINNEMITTNDSNQSDTILSICNSNTQMMDDNVIESAFILFIENTIKLCNKAIIENRYILTDKLLYNLFHKLNEIYGNILNESCKGEINFHNINNNNKHPLFNNINDNIINNIPDIIKININNIINNNYYKIAIIEKLLICDLLDKFNMIHIKNLCIDFHQPILNNLWFNSLESIITNNISNDNLNTNNISNDNLNNTNNISYSRYNSFNSNLVQRINQIRLNNLPSLPIINNKNYKLSIIQTFNYLKTTTKRLKNTKTIVLKQHFKKIKIKTADGWIKEPCMFTHII